ncbi:MAG: hypothetical protein RI958_2930 [Actinomycetota bacterium]
MLDRVIELADRLRAGGFGVSTGEVIDACESLGRIDLADRALVRAVLRATLVKTADPHGRFDAEFERVFREAPDLAGRSATAAASLDAPRSPEGPTSSSLATGALDDAVLRALLDHDHESLAALAALAVDAYSGIGDHLGTERYFVHRVLRAVDLSRMLSAAMQQLRRDGELDELELMLQRTQFAAALEEFRRRLASEIASRLDDRGATADVAPPERTAPEDLELLSLSRAEYEQVRRMLQPLIRTLAARIGQKRRRGSTGRLDVRRTVRRSMQSGGVPLDVVMRRRRRHRPEVVVMCDVSGSVAEFAQFMFTIINGLHAELRNVRSFAFVDGVAEVSDVFADARYEVAVNRLVERRGVLGLDGHSDYGKVFERFVQRHLDDAVGSATTVVITGDARGNYRDGGVEHLERIASRARRVYWLNPEAASTWGEDDSLVGAYRHACTDMFEVRTLAQLADVITELV